ncbi:hypothetical protein JW859_07830 [bacterium]|nr:hypothetical protein [bacterium]
MKVRELLVSAIVVMLLVASCAGTRSAGVVCQGTIEPTGRGQVGATQAALPDALAELEGLSPPEDVSSADWNELTAALAAELKRLYGGNGPGRLAAAAPQGTVNKVRDLTMSAEGDQWRLEWSYLNVGDYDQNGEVNASDLTPLGVNFKKSGPFDWDSSLSVVDGDGNGMINISDITPIGQNYKASLKSYAVEWAPAVDGPWTAAGHEVAVPAPDPASARISFSELVDLPAEAEYVRVVPRDTAGNAGSESYVNDSMLVVRAIEGPATVYDNATATYSVAASGATGITYSWSAIQSTSGVVSPADAPSVVFTPADVSTDTNAWIVVTVEADGDQSVQLGKEITIVDTGGPDEYVASGTVTLSGGDPLEDVSVEISDLDGALGWALTDEEGYWGFAHLSDGTYTATPELDGYTFDPASREFEISGSNVSELDFAATSTQTTVTWRDWNSVNHNHLCNRQSTHVGPKYEKDIKVFKEFSQYRYFNGLVLDSENSIYLTAMADTGNILVKLDCMGNIIWERDYDHQGFPAIGPNGMVYIYGIEYIDNNDVIGVVDQSGELKYVSDLDNFTDTLTIAPDGTLYSYRWTDDRFWRFDSECQSMYQLPVDVGDGSNERPATVSLDGHVYLNVEGEDGNPSRMICFDNQGNLIWDALFPEGESSYINYSSPLQIRNDGSLYIAKRRNLYGINPENGEVLWSEQLRESYTFDPWPSNDNDGFAVTAAGRIILVEGHLFCFSVTSECEWVWDMPFGLSPVPPTIGAHGTIFLLDREYLYCLPDNFDPDDPFNNEPNYIIELPDDGISEYIGPPAVGSDNRLYFYKGERLFVVGN